MKQALAFSALGLGALVKAAPQHYTGNGFQLYARGKAQGFLGQLGDGQNRIGGNLSTATYYIKDTSIVDDFGRGCILTPPTTQFQCDEGAEPNTGFSIGCSGQLSHSGKTSFYSCPVNDYGEWNVYSKPAPGQLKCVEITLWASSSVAWWTQGSSCTPPRPTSKPHKQALPSPPPAPQVKPIPSPHPIPQEDPTPSPPPAQVKPSPSPRPVPQEDSTPSPHPTPQEHSVSTPCPATCPCASSCPCIREDPTPSPSTRHEGPASSACPTPSPRPTPQEEPTPEEMPLPTVPDYCPPDLQGNFEFPHLIIPINKSEPSHAYGTSLNGSVSPNTCSIFNFDISEDFHGKQCTLFFLFPVKEQLVTSDWTLSGKGLVSFNELEAPASKSTTWASRPEKKEELGSVDLEPGNGYAIWSGDCRAGEKVGYSMCSNGTLSLDYFQDFNPSPIGLYLRQC